MCDNWYPPTNILNLLLSPFLSRYSRPYTWQIFRPGDLARNGSVSKGSVDWMEEENLNGLSHFSLLLRINRTITDTRSWLEINGNEFHVTSSGTAGRPICLGDRGWHISPIHWSVVDPASPFQRQTPTYYTPNLHYYHKSHCIPKLTLFYTLSPMPESGFQVSLNMDKSSRCKMYMYSSSFDTPLHAWIAFYQ